MNYRTTIFGLAAAIGTVLVNQTNNTLKIIGQCLQAAGTLGLGAAAQDYANKK